MNTKRLFAYSNQLPLLLLVLLNLSEAQSSSKTETRRRSLALIMPGTKWCGAGDVATDHDDLGPLKDLDVCCRDHDDCPQSIEAGETKYGYVNDRTYTFSSCDCDKRFRECLQKVGDQASEVVANLYSATFKNKCFNLEKSRKCTETSQSGECTQYSDVETAVESELPEPEERE